MDFHFPVPVTVEFRRVVKDSRGRPGKGHLTLNFKSLCEGDGRWLKNYETERITVEQFVDNSCDTCYRRLNGNR